MASRRWHKGCVSWELVVFVSPSLKCESKLQNYHVTYQQVDR